VGKNLCSQKAGKEEVDSFSGVRKQLCGSGMEKKRGQRSSLTLGNKVPDFTERRVYLGGGGGKKRSGEVLLLFRFPLGPNQRRRKGRPQKKYREGRYQG